MYSWLPGLGFRKQLLLCEPVRHLDALFGSRSRAKTGVVVLLVRPDMRGRYRQADSNVIWCDVEHHEILRQRQQTIIMRADRPFDFGGGVEVIEEVVDDGETRLDQSE